MNAGATFAIEDEIAELPSARLGAVGSIFETDCDHRAVILAEVEFVGSPFLSPVTAGGSCGEVSESEVVGIFAALHIEAIVVDLSSGEVEAESLFEAEAAVLIVCEVERFLNLSVCSVICSLIVRVGDSALGIAVDLPAAIVRESLIIDLSPIIDA